MKRLSIRQMVLAAALAVGTALAAVAADPKTMTWTGDAGDSAWATAENWDLGAVPGSGDYAIFNTTPEQPITLNGSKSVADFFMSGNSAAFTTDNGTPRMLTLNIKDGCGNGWFLDNGTLEVVGSNNAVKVTGGTKAVLGDGAVLKASDGGQFTLTKGDFGTSKNVKMIATGKRGTLASKITGSTWSATTLKLAPENTGFSFEAYDGGVIAFSKILQFVKGNNPTFIADGGNMSLGNNAVMLEGGDLSITSKNAGVFTMGAITGNPSVEATTGGKVTPGAITGNSAIMAKDVGTTVTLAAVTGDSTVECSDGAFVKFGAAVKGNVDVTTKNNAYVQFANTLSLGTEPYKFYCDGATNLFSNTITGDPSLVCTNGGIVTFSTITGNPTFDCSGVGSIVKFNSSKNIAGNSTITSSNGGSVTTLAANGNVTLFSTDEGSKITLSSFGVASGSSTLRATEKGSITSGATKGDVSIAVDKGAEVKLTSTMAAGTHAHTIVSSNEDSVVWIQNTITGATSIDASDKGTVKLVNAAGTTYQKITGATTIVCTNEGSTVQLAGFGNTGLNSSITATDKGTVMAGASLGNVAIAVDKGAEVKLTSTMATGNHTIACSNEDSVVWIQNTVTGNPVITCEDKGTVKLVKADDKTAIGVSGYPTVMCSGEGSSVTMGNLGATAAGVNVLKAKDGATVTVGTTKFTIQAEASNGALLTMGSMTPSANDNEIVADNATIQFTGAMNGNKSFTSVYEVKGADGLIEGVKANLLFGSDAKTTVKLMPLRSRSSAFIKTTTSGDITFGAGVNYVVDVSDVSQDAFYGDKKYLIAESAGKLTFNAPTSVTVTGAEPEYYSASLAAEGTKLYLTVTSRKVPEGKVAVVGIDEFYETLGEAVANVENGGLIGVMTDVAVAEKIANPEGKTVTLNLNGNTLTSELTDCVIDNAGTLVLKGAGTIESETAAALIINRPTGVLTIEDGTYTCAKVLDNQTQEENLGAVTVATAVFNGTTENSGSLSVKGGTFGAMSNNGSLTITAGTYGALSNNGVLSISGGLFSGNEYALYNCCTATVSSGTFDGIVACDGEVGALEITGGTFKSEVVAKADSAEIAIAGLVGVSLNKATFAVDETAYCEDGFVTFKNGDVYIVRRASDVVITPVNANTELGTLTVEGVGTQISELGETLRGTITNVKAGFVPVILIGGQRVNVAEDGSFEGPAVESAEVVAAYIKADAWYLDPFVKNDGVAVEYMDFGVDRMGDLVLSSDGSKLFSAPGWQNYIACDGAYTGLLQFNVPALSSFVGSYFEIENGQLGSSKDFTEINTQYEAFRSIVPVGNDYVIIGQTRNEVCSPDHPGMCAQSSIYPVGGDWGDPKFGGTVEGDDRYVCYSDINMGTAVASASDSTLVQWHAAGVVSSDGKYVYLANYARNEIVKLALGEDENGKAAWTKTGIWWHTKDEDIFNGNACNALALLPTANGDVVFASLTDGRLVKLNETELSGNTFVDHHEGATEMVADYKMEFVANFGKVRAMRVTGVADGAPHLQVFTFDAANSALKIYALTTDGDLASTTPIATYQGGNAQIANGYYQNVVSSDDETIAFVHYEEKNRAAYGNTQYYRMAVVSAKPAQVTVRGTFTTYEEGVDTMVDFGGAAEVTWTAPTGYAISAVKVNGTAVGGWTQATSYTFTDAELAKNVYIEMTLVKMPVAQIGSAKYTELDAAFAAAKAGDTVELLRDAEVGATLNNSAAITLDLGGFTLTRTADAADFMFVAGADLTITNGTINGGSLKVLDISAGTVVLGDGLYVTAAVNCFLKAYNGVLTIAAGCVVESSNDLLDADVASTVNVYGTMKRLNNGTERPLMWASCVAVNVYDGAVMSSDCGDVFRSNAGAVSINIYGGTISSTRGYCVFYSYNASTATKYTIYGGSIKAVSSDSVVSIFSIRAEAVNTTVTPLTDQCTAKFFGTQGVANYVADGYGMVKGEDGWYTIQKLYDIAIAAAENGMVETSVTNGIVAGTEVTITVTPAETYAVDKVYTNNVELAAVEEVYTFLMPAENVEVKATFKATAKPPYEPIPAVDPAAKAAEINEGGIAAKKAVIALPEGLESVPDSYYGLFSAVPGDGVVLIELNEDGTNAVETAEQAAGTAALDAVLGTDEASAALTVVEPLAGFFYSLKQSAAIESLGFKVDGDKNKLGGRDSISFTLDKSETSGFYQMIVSPTPVK